MQEPTSTGTGPGNGPGHESGSKPELPVLYRERLWPSPVIWLITAGLGALFGLIPAPISPVAAVVTGVLVAAALMTALAASTPSVEVDAEWFRAGRARIRRSLLGPAEPLDPASMRRVRGPQLDARAYLCLRGWLKQGVRVPVNDPRDPAPYWLVSSRTPEELARALRS